MVWCQMNQPQIGQSGAYERCRELVGTLDRCSSALRTRSGRAACACDRWAQPTPAPWFAYRSRPKVCLYVPFEPMDREAIPRHITVGWARQRVTAEGEALFLGAELASVGEVIADVTLWFQGAERRPGEVGWVFNPDPSRQGYATEAVQRRPAPGVRPARAAPRGGQVDARNDASLRFAGRASGAARTKFHVLR